jgi:thiamine pyrophosphate-dependent acetolactate synthase large subunit-like protein
VSTEPGQLQFRDGFARDCPLQRGVCELPVPKPPSRLRRFTADAEGVAKAAEMLIAGERPAIIVGQGVRHGGAAAELLQLAGRLQISVGASASGLGAIDCHHPLSLGLVSRGGLYQANGAMRPG